MHCQKIESTPCRGPLLSVAPAFIVVRQFNEHSRSQWPCIAVTESCSNRCSNHVTHSTCAAGTAADATVVIWLRAGDEGACGHSTHKSLCSITSWSKTAHLLHDCVRYPLTVDHQVRRYVGAPSLLLVLTPPLPPQPLKSCCHPLMPTI